WKKVPAQVLITNDPNSAVVWSFAKVEPNRFTEVAPRWHVQACGYLLSRDKDEKPYYLDAQAEPLLRTDAKGTRKFYNVALSAEPKLVVERTIDIGTAELAAERAKFARYVPRGRHRGFANPLQTPRTKFAGCGDPEVLHRMRAFADWGKKTIEPFV